MTTSAQYAEQREKREARERKREAKREACAQELLARFRAAETVWRCADDEDDEGIYYDGPIWYFLTKEDALAFQGDEVEEWLIQVAPPANVTVIRTAPAAFEAEGGADNPAPRATVPQEAATVPQEAPQVPAGITQLSLFDVVPTTDGTLTPTSWTPRSI